MIGVNTFIGRYDSFLQKALKTLSYADFTYHTTQEVEVDGHTKIFELAWVRSALLFDEEHTPIQVEGSITEVVDGYFTRMYRRLRKQARQSSSLFEQQVASGAIAALRVMQGRARSEEPLALAVYKHAQVLKSRAGGPDEYSRTYHSWSVSLGGFQDNPYTLTSTAKNQFDRMVETAPPGAVARTGVHVGDRPPRFSDGSATIASRFLLKTGQYRDVTLADVVCNIGASFQTSLPHLKKFTTPQAVAGSYALLRQTTINAYQGLGLTQLVTPRISDIWRARVNPDAHPGFLAKQMYNNKRQAWFSTGRLAECVWRQLEKGPAVHALPFVVGGREKRQERNVGEAITSRLVQMPEDVITRLEAVVAEPLLERFKVMAMDIRVGMTYAHRDFEEHSRKFSPCTHVKTFDWSSYDSSVGRKLIMSAFAIMRAQFPPGDFMDNLMMYLMSGFIRRNLVCPGGDVVEMDRGVPSGSGFTSLVGSVINWLVLRSTATSLDPLRAHKVRIAVQGDDSVIGWMNAPFPETDVFLREAERLWAVKAGNANPLVSTEGVFDGPTPDTSQSFLSVRIHNGLPTWGFRDFWVTEVGYRKPIHDPEKAMAAFIDWAGFPCLSTEITKTIQDYKEYLISLLPNGEDYRPILDFIEEQNALHSINIHLVPDDLGYNEVGVNHWGQKGRYFNEWPLRARKIAHDRLDYRQWPGFTKVADSYALNLFRHPLGCPLRVRGFQSRGTHLKAVRRWLSHRPARAFIPEDVMIEMGHNKRLSRMLPLLRRVVGGGVLDTDAYVPQVHVPDATSRQYLQLGPGLLRRRQRRRWVIPRRTPPQPTMD